MINLTTPKCKTQKISFNSRNECCQKKSHLVANKNFYYVRDMSSANLIMMKFEV